MFDIKQELRLKIAAEMGYDVEDPLSAANLILCIKYNDLKFSDRSLTDAQIAAKLGVNKRLLVELKTSDAIKVGTRIVLAEFLTDEKRQEIRADLFQIYQDNLADVMRHIVEIAKGELPAPFRDQVSAAALMLENPLGNAFLVNTFVGETHSLEEAAHLDMRSKLLERGKVLDLDIDVIDANVSSHD